MKRLMTGMVGLSVWIAGTALPQRVNADEPGVDPVPRTPDLAARDVPHLGDRDAAYGRADEPVVRPEADADTRRVAPTELSPVPAAEPMLAQMGTSFSYQGYLEVDGAPHTGACDFQFRLWTVASGGTSIGTTNTLTGVQVDDGLYEVTLNFGSSSLYFNGEARWLSIGVKCPPDTSYTTLSPRQELLPTPYAFALPGMRTEENATSPNVFGGYHGNFSLSGTIGVTVGGGGASGADHHVTDSYCTIAGGRNNLAGDALGTVSDAMFATVGGGVNNQARDYWATVGGGDSNTASNWNATVSGGVLNNATADTSTVGGGYSNSAGGTQATTVGGGWHNTAGSVASTVAGGKDNVASSGRSAIGGGEFNEANGGWATVGGGLSNTGELELTAIGGGWGNLANGPRSAIGGGESNELHDLWGTIGGGWDNRIGTDDGDETNSELATIGGGYLNLALGSFSTIPGGRENYTSFPYTLAAGYKARAIHAGSFVWADSNLGASQRDASDYFRSTQSNDFSVLATGGVNFDVNNGHWVVIEDAVSRLIRASNGAYLSIGGTWVNGSDVNSKQDFASINSRDVLERVADLPISTWSYKAEDSSNRHIGPTAQDFAKAFGLGDSDTAIATIDADGVALTAIQGLYDLVREKEETISALEARLSRLENQLAETAAHAGGEK